MPVNNSDFMEALEMYKMNYVNEYSLTVLEQSAQILVDGIKHAGKTKVGYDDMRTHLKSGFN